MAFSQSLIWTVLPFGVTRDTDNRPYLNFSVIVSPRLQGSAPTTLVHYPDWSGLSVNGAGGGRAWPATISVLASSFKLVLQGLNVSYPARLIGTHAPDSARFATIFPTGTPVTPYQYKGFEGRKIRSAPVGSTVDLIQSLYGQFGLTSPTVFPSYDSLVPATSFGPMGFEQDPGATAVSVDRGIPGSGPERKAKLNAALEGAFAHARAIPYDLTALAASIHPAIPGAAASLAFLQHQRFLQRGLKPRVTTKPPVPEWDFHQMVAGLGSLPTLLRVLGLVLDMQVGPVDPAVLTHGHVPVWLDSDASRFELTTTPVHPMTYAVLTASEFRPDSKAGAASDHTGRMLKLGDPSLYRVIRVDHDNAVVKTMQFANTVTRSRKAGKALTLTTPSQFALPALKTGGFAIARSGRAVQMAAVLAHQTADLQDKFFGGSNPPPLYLEDLIRGYRFDVLDRGDGIWRSLMWRQGTVTVNGNEPLDVLEEDTVVPAPTTASQADHAGDLYLQETLTRWDGWSLAVPRLGQPFQGIGATNAAQGSSGLNVTTDWHVPGSARTGAAETTTSNAMRLPRLRFGRTYQLRARATDLAGNALPVESAPATSTVVSAPTKHLRFEPVPAPRVLLVDEPLPGASEEVVVIRSESATVDGTGVLDNGETVRLLVPAPTSVFMAEQLGAFDLATAGRPMSQAAAVYQTIAARDAVNIEADGKLVDPSNAHGTDNPFTYPAFLPIHYLPEVLGRTALVRGLPVNSSKKTVAALPFDTAAKGWPTLQGARVRLSRGSVNWSTVKVTDPNNTGNVTTELDLTLAKGDMFTAVVNCQIDQAAVSIMAVWEWIEQYAAAHSKNPATVLTAILNGEHWMFTPWRRVTFVHAVRTPLVKPQLFLKPKKTAIGQTYAAFDGLTDPYAGTVLMSRKSTARVDVDATWSMPIDTGTNTDPVTPVPFHGHAFSVELSRTGTGVKPATGASVVRIADAENVNLTHEFNDTKYRAVTYAGTATSFYVEYFRQQLKLALSGDPVTALKAHATKPDVAFEESTVQLTLTWTEPGPAPDHDPQPRSRVLVRAPAGTSPTTGDPALGDYVVVPDPSNGTAGTVQLLAKSTVKSTGLTSPAIVFSYVAPTIHTYSNPAADRTQALHVLNTKRPDAPHVLYVIPIYKRTSTLTSVTRRGGALRVYLDRPWWSSGDGERLGVVCWQKSAHSSQTLPPADLRPHVTLWGYDPVFKSTTALPGQPTPDCFPLVTATGSSLSLEEVSEHVSVAGHSVGYDTHRGLWYCDIRVTGPNGKELRSYMPFIRFAFARYQPNSISGAQLSKVVVADYAQLAPNRFVTVTGSGATRTVTVAGRAPVKTVASSNPSKMRVVIEQYDQRIPDYDLAWSRATGPHGFKNVVELSHAVSDGDYVTWRGSIHLPARNRHALRLTFEEFERINGGLGEGRLVFTDSVPLNVG